MSLLKLEDLTIEQKIGQMLIARPPLNKKDKEFMLDLLRNKALGAIHATAYFRPVRNDNDIEETDREMVWEFREAAGYPVLICEDMEYGFIDGKVELPSPLAIAGTYNEEYAYEFARITAIEAKAAGYSVVFGPMFDIAMNPGSSCVGARAWGGDKEMVARMATAAVRGYQDQGMIVSAKHCPGSGAEEIDNHIRLSPLNLSAQDMIDRELYPYIKAMREADLSGIMMGQVFAPQIDDEFPATLSPKIIKLIRDQGYNGLIITDSFTMVSLRNKYSLEDCLRLGMAAGNDMVMTSYREDCRTAYEAMLKAYKDGYVTERQIDAAVTRVLAAQEKTLKPALQKEITPREYELADRMARDSISVHLNGTDSVSIDPSQKYLIVIEEGNVFTDPVTGKQVQEDANIISAAEQEIRSRFVNSDFIKFSEFPSQKQMLHYLRESIFYDRIIMLTYNKSIAYTGSSDLTKRMIAFMEGVAEKIEAVLLFGNPYAAREFPPVKRVIFGYESKTGQRYAVKALAGEFAPTGKLPVDVKFRRA